MDWQTILKVLKDQVIVGKITTYGELSQFAYRHRGGAQSIRAMLEAAVNANAGNSKWTNRVVKTDGTVADVHGQLVQLVAEGVPVTVDKTVDFTRCPPVIILIANQKPLPPKKPPIPPESMPESLPSPGREIVRKWKDLKFNHNIIDGSLTWTGFDSAWTAQNHGAIAWMTGDRDGLYFYDAKRANFEDCLTHIEEEKVLNDMHILTIDQPTIVLNQAGRRPVDAAVSHEIGRAGGGVQPANLSRDDMFGENAPIDSFLGKLGILGFQETAVGSVGSTDGLYFLETYPALGNLGLFGYHRCPKYNPERDTFSLQDWKRLCRDIEQLGAILEIDNLKPWIREMLALKKPCKEDQDQIDAVLCMLNGYIWWRAGTSHSICLGGLRNGYMVVPCIPIGFKERLRSDAEIHDVSFNEPF